MGPLAQDSVEAKWAGRLRESGFRRRALASRLSPAMPLLHAGLVDFLEQGSRWAFQVVRIHSIMLTDS